MSGIFISRYSGTRCPGRDTIEVGDRIAYFSTLEGDKLVHVDNEACERAATRLRVAIEKRHASALP